MVDLKVIQGGGGDGIDHDAVYRAEVAFERLAVELLRALARGDGSSRRVSPVLIELFRALEKSGSRVSPIIDDALTNLNGRLFVDREDDFEEDVNELKSTFLRYAVECLATDGFAKGRASQRYSDFSRAVEAFVIGQELRSRKYNGSYLLRLLARLPPFPVPTAPRVTKPKRKAESGKAKPVKKDESLG